MAASTEVMVGFDPLALAIGVGLALTLTLLVACFPSKARKRLDRRLVRIRRYRNRTTTAEAGPSISLNSSDSSIGGLDRLIKRHLPSPEQLRQRLARTGKRIQIGEYVLASLFTALLTLIVSYGFLDVQFLLALPLSIFAGIGLPHAFIGSLIAGRRKKFVSLFPEAIDLIVRGLKSGLPVTESIRVVSEEMPSPVGEEFRQISDALRFGQTLEEALSTTARRLDIQEFQFFVISLQVQRETGGNLTETLENLANILRRRKQMRLKIRALSSEARASAMIIGSLPFLTFAAILALSPDYASMLVNDPRGHTLVAIAFVSMCLGAGIMIRMARFEI